jgi:hypothetical protein
MCSSEPKFHLKKTGGWLRPVTELDDSSINIAIKPWCPFMIFRPFPGNSIRHVETSVNRHPERSAARDSGFSTNDASAARVCALSQGRATTGIYRFEKHPQLVIRSALFSATWRYKRVWTINFDCLECLDPERRV